MQCCEVLVLCMVCLSSWQLSAGGIFNLTVLHTNDVHARFDEANAFGGRCPEKDSQAGKCFGGVARLKTKVNEIRQKEKNTLFLNAGDYYQGTLYFTEFSYNITADFNNRLQYDAVSLGNHEFDLGVEGLYPFIDLVDFPVLACNLDLGNEPRLQGKVGCMKTFQFGSEQVAVVGFVTPETRDLSNPGKVMFKDEIVVLQKVVQELLAKGVNKIIAVGHSGYAKDMEIAEKVEGLDVVVGGHTNSFLYSGNPPTVEEEVVGPYPTVITQKDGSKVLVVQDYAYAKYLGRLTVQFDEAGRVKTWSGNPVLLDASVKMDKEIVDALEPYKKAVEAKDTYVVGHTSVLLRGDRLHCRLMECNLGNLITDASVRYYSKIPFEYGWAKYTISLIVSGGIRASIDEKVNEGNVTIGDVLTVLPFGNTVDLAALYGVHLRQAMEWSVQNYNTRDPVGGFLQISGLKVWYDLCRPPGQRVVGLKALCSRCRVPRYFDVEDDQLYHLVLPTFVLDGGDGHKAIKENAVNVSRTGALDADVLLQELEKFSPLTIGEEDRINFVNRIDDCGKNTSPALTCTFLSVLFLSVCFSSFTNMLSSDT